MPEYFELFKGLRLVFHQIHISVSRQIIGKGNEGRYNHPWHAYQMAHTHRCIPGQVTQWPSPRVLQRIIWQFFLKVGFTSWIRHWIKKVKDPIFFQSIYPVLSNMV